MDALNVDAVCCYANLMPVDILNVFRKKRHKKIHKTNTNEYILHVSIGKDKRITLHLCNVKFPPKKKQNKNSVHSIRENNNTD